MYLVHPSVHLLFCLFIRLAMQVPDSSVVVSGGGEGYISGCWI